MDVPTSAVIDGEHAAFIGVNGARYVSLKFSLSMLAWSIGFVIGFDFGITGTLLSMPAFLEEYFPNAYKNTVSDPLGDFYSNIYRSCLYLAAFASASAITVSRIHTHAKMRLGAWLMFAGMLLSFFVMDTRLMTCGRILFGVSIGILLQVMVSHPSETAPPAYRGGVAILFSQGISLGILFASVWFGVLRVSPTKGRVLAIWGSIFQSVVQSLFCVVSAASIGGEIKILFDDSSEAVDRHLKTVGPARYEAARSLIRQVEVSPVSVLFEREYVPPLVVAVCVSVLQQFTGVYALMIYAPVLFRTIGLDEAHSLLCSYLMYIPNLFATPPTEKFERRRSLFMQGGITMLLSLIIIALILNVRENLGAMPGWNTILLAVAMALAICAYVGGFAWSWGQLGWLVPSQILPVKIRSIGYSMCVSMNMLSMFFVTQFFPMWLCKTSFGMHLVILCSVLLMTVFVYVFLPDTKGVDDVDDVSQIWRGHWFWDRFVVEHKVFALSEESFENA